MTQVRFQGWRAGFEKIALNHLLREHADLTLAAAKDVVDRILDGETVVVAVESPAKAQTLADAASALGADCEMIEASTERN